MKTTGAEKSLQVFRIFETKRQLVEVRATLGSFAEYRRAILWMREQGCSADRLLELAASGARPWRTA